MQIECFFMNTTELHQSGFRNSPEVLNTVNMVRTLSKFILSMLNAMMSFVAKIDQAIIGLKPVCIHHRFFTNLFPYNGQKLFGRTVFNYRGVDFATSLDQAENDVFPPCAATTDTTNTARAKVAFIDLYLTGLKWTFGLTEFGNSPPNNFEHPVNSRTAHTRQLGNFRRFDIKRKIPNNLSNFLLRYFGMKYIFVTHCFKIT